MTTVVVGGGASGMMASIFAADKGNNVILIEKNEKLGKKIYITGKGRCNITNLVEPREFLSNVCTNEKFLFSAINSFSSSDTTTFFNENGLKTKVERGNRVFPESDHASDVTKTLEKKIRQLGVDVRLNTIVNSINIENGIIKSVSTDKGEIICDSVVVCTGGVSYPLTGSTGDGYRFARRCGHNVIDPKPSLCGLELNGSDFVELQGLTLKNVAIKVFADDKLIYEDFGEMLFTHFGVSGPIILSASCFVNKHIGKKVNIVIDLKPALSKEVLENRLLNEFSENSNKEISNVMRSLLPRSLISLILKNSNIRQLKKCNEITKEQRVSLILNIKNLKFNVSSLRKIDEAIVTSGGVNVKEINPKTMESKLVKGLYFAGEVIDVDAFTGGFNLQIAFSTGYLAGKNC